MTAQSQAENGAKAAAVIESVGLRKRFGRSAALDGLALTVAAGEVHGFLGPNGAGKSTTIRILLGLMRADTGSVRVLGREPWRESVSIHREVAYVPGDVSLWPNLTGGEIIDLLTTLRGGADESLRRALVADFDLDLRKKARSYSKGNRQKVALVAAFARPARLYILDEPTSGLDPVMEAVFRRHVQRVRADGAAVLLSSHLLGEVEQLCDRVTIIRAGVAVESGTLAELRHLTRTHFRVTPAATGPGAGSVLELAAAAERAAADIRGIHDVRPSADSVEFAVDAAALADAIAWVATVRPSAITVSPPSLESLFLHHYATAPEAATPSGGR